MPKTEAVVELYYDGDWHEVPAYVRDPISPSWGLASEGGGLTPATCTVTLDNRGGDYDPSDPRSTLYGLIGRNTPARVTLPGGYTVCRGAVSSWAPDRAVKGDAWTTITVSGVAELVNGSSRVLFSRMRQFTEDAGPVAYWAFDAGRVSTAGGVTAGSGSDFIHVTGAGSVRAGEADVAAWLEPFALLTGEVRADAQVTMEPEPNELVMEWTRRLPADPQATLQMVFVGNAPHQALSWTIDMLAGGLNEIEVTATRADGSHSGDVVVNAAAFTDQLTHFRLEAVPSGIADVDWELFLNGSSVLSGTVTFATLTGISQVRVAQTVASDTDTQAVGHVVIWTDNAPNLSSTYYALQGAPEELAAERFERVCQENGIAATVVGDPAATAPMGPQIPATLAATLEEIAATDNALIHDAVDDYALVMVTGRSRYNRTPVLGLTYGTDVGVPLRPVVDAIGVTNDLLVTRNQGGTYHTARLTGPLNTSDPFIDPEGIGVRQGRLSVNTASDTALPGIGQWGLHTGTWPAARYESVTVDLTEHPGHLAAALDARPGDLVTIADFEPDLVELQVIGGSYRVENNRLLVEFRCVPGGPYRIGQVETAGYMRLGSSTSTLGADFDIGADSFMTVDVTGALWSTTAPPFHIRVGGAVLNVTAVSGASSPQTFTVDSLPVNGVQRLLLTTGPAALTRITTYPPIFIGL